MEIIYTAEFIKLYKKLPQKIKTLAQQKEELFIENPFNPQLRTHKLQGRLYGYLAFSVNFRYRIVFRFREANSVYFVAIGGHEVYK